MRHIGVCLMFLCSSKKAALIILQAVARALNIINKKLAYIPEVSAGESATSFRVMKMTKQLSDHIDINMIC